MTSNAVRLGVTALYEPYPFVGPPAGPAYLAYPVVVPAGGLVSMPPPNPDSIPVIPESTPAPVASDVNSIVVPLLLLAGVALVASAL